jgi:ketosteroid isomerase-like protein
VSANLDLVRSIFAAWERGDFSSFDWAHPEVELVVVDGPSPTTVTGVSQMTEWFNDFLSVWEGYRLASDEYRELDDKRVLVLGRNSGGRGKASGLELGRQGGGGAVIFEIHAGKVTRQVTYFNRDRGLADLGLGPETGSVR